MHLPGRQVDPQQVRRDLWRLRCWEREPRRTPRTGGEAARGAAHERLRPDRSRHARPQPPVVEGPDRAAARSYLYSIGLTDDDLRKPIVGVANTWIGTMPCNFHLRRLSQKVMEGIRAAGGTPLEYNTIAISDGITMGTEGMKTSLVSREVIADSIELVARGHMFDAVVALSGCDKTIPGTVMALARLDIPSLMIYGGSIAPGRFHDKDVTIQDVFEARRRARRRRHRRRRAVASSSTPRVPAPGACGGQFTANTMATAFEVMGISPMGSAMVPAMDPRKDEVCVEAGQARDEAARVGPEAERRDHARLARERDRRGRRHGRLDQRRAAPAGRRLRGRHRARARGLRPHQRPHAAARGPQARRAVRRRRPLRRRRRRRSSPSGCSTRAC